MYCYVMFCPTISWVVTKPPQTFWLFPSVLRFCSVSKLRSKLEKNICTTDVIKKSITAFQSWQSELIITDKSFPISLNRDWHSNSIYWVWKQRTNNSSLTTPASILLQLFQRQKVTPDEPQGSQTYGTEHRTAVATLTGGNDRSIEWHSHDWRSFGS